MTTEDDNFRWTIRGIHPDLKNLVATRASIERRTVGEIVTEALASYLGRPVQSDVTDTLVDRVAALEARLNEAVTGLADLESIVSATPLSATRPTVVTEERPEPHPRRSRGVVLTREIIAQVKALAAEGKSQRQMAVEVGISAGSVSNILNGKESAN